jgi:PKD repeat protein
MENKPLTSIPDYRFGPRLFLLIALMLSSFWLKAAPPAYFTISPSTGCAPLLVQCFNASGPGIYAWNFGDTTSGPSDTSSACSPSHVFNTPGVYTITLHVAGGTTHTEIVTVLAGPAPHITGTMGVCAGTSDTYSVPYTPGNTYSWTVTNGVYTTIMPGNAINVTWVTPGVGDITVTETNASGCKSTDIIHVIISAKPDVSSHMPCGGRKEIDPTNSGTAAKGSDSGSTVSCICPNSLSMYSMPSDGNTYYWSVTNGTIITIGPRGETVTVKWGHTGTSTITVVEVSPFGCKDSVTCTFTICPGPTASFSAPTVCLGAPTTFTNASVGTPYIIGYNWDFGDGDHSTLSDPSHTYSAPGTYHVKLTVTDGKGCTDDTTIDVIVTPGTGPKIVCISSVCAYSKATYSTLSIAGATYTWAVTGDVVDSPSGNTIIVYWGAGPTGTITLTVSGTSYYSCGMPTTVTVPILPAVPPVSGPTSVCIGPTYTYTAPSVPGTSYTWTVTGAATYSSSGNTLNVVWDGSATGTITVKMHNEILCCEGTNTITVTKKPDLNITGTQTACALGTGYVYTLPISGDWTVTGGTITSGTGLGVNTITVTWGAAGTGLITVTTTSTAYCNPVATISVSIIPAPAPVSISGLSAVCIPTGITTYTASAGSGIISSIWSLSGGGTIPSQTSTSADVVWTTPGVYVVHLTQTNTALCTTVSDYTVIVSDHTLPVITGPLVSCVNDIKTYTFTSSLPASTYDWSIIGGIILSGIGTDTITVQWGYAAPGTVTLTNLICGNSTSIIVNIMDVPVVTIDSVGINCDTLGFDLRANTGAGNTILWNTGSTTPMAHVTHSGLYKVTVTNLAGCSTVVSVLLSPIPTWPHPVATITKTALLPSPGPLYIRFCVPAVPGNTYHWSSGETSPCIDVLSSDTVPRKIVVTNSYGCKDSAIDSNIVGVIPPCPTCPPPPPPCFISVSCPVGGVVTATAGSGTGYLWGDGTTGSSDTTSVPGDTLSVSFTDYLGNPQHCYYVYPGPAPTPAFTVPIPTCNPVTFINTTTPSAPFYFWDFGDGLHSTDISPTHSYTATGTFNVTLYTSMDGRCWSSLTQTATIKNLVTADWTWAAACTPAVNFNSTSTLLGPGPFNFFWDFGDGSPIASGVSTSHIYTVGGYYTVKLIVVSGFGASRCSTTVIKTIPVPLLQALFSTCGIGCMNHSTQVIDMSLHTSTIVSWAWDFGNGNHSTLQNPWNIYTLPGTYTVKLTVTDSRGCTSTDSVSVTVTPFPVVSITALSDTIFCGGDSVVLSASAGFYYIWSDGETTQNITVKTTGNYYCTIIDASGCSEKVGPVHVIVHDRPRAIITPSGPLTICSSDVLTLSGPSGVGYLYTWYKNGVSMGLPPSTSMITISGTLMTGVYTLVVSNAYGCKDSSGPDSVVVNGAPFVIIGPSTSYLCSGSSVTLYTILYSGGPILSYLWNTGATTSSIVITTPGMYSVTVTGTSGCPYTAYYNIPAIPPADFESLPKGCYTICAGSSATLTLPSGYTYNWFNGATLVGTGTSFTISAAGNYWVQAINIPYGCIDSSDTFHVTVIPGPTVHITGSGPLVICEGSSGSLTLTATASTAVTYLWNTGATTSSIVITAPGVYYVTVHSTACCAGTDTVKVDSANCCFPPGDIFINVPDSTVISADQVWDGKYFVQGKVHVTGSATLDLSVVDIIFAPKGEIIFHDSTTIRANNSVLRPCQINGTWVGLTFLDNSRGLIHTCTFKNAEQAVNVNSATDYSVKLVDNTFSQCHTAIYINKYGNNYTEGITGNSMVIDDTKLPFASDDYFGIELHKVNMQELVSQNSFRNATKVGQYKNFYGIFALGTSTTISANTFSNMHRSIDIETPVNYLSIENNTIEVTQSSTPNDYQIRIDNSNVPVIVFNNQISNSIPNPAKTSAIYGYNSSLLNINENRITGYSYGIELHQVTASQVLENNIRSTKLIGIYYEDGGVEASSDVDIACNEIDMDLVPQVVSVSTPIGISTINADGATSIRGNCVSNTSNAIYVYSAYGETIPLIRNNFLYNYINNGVYNDGHFGDIGTGGPPFTSAGRNTFVSNNVLATDINSTTALTEGGNYGDYVLSGTISSSGTPDLYSSTASCAKQINYARPTDIVIDDIAICDHFDEILYPYLEQTVPDSFMLAPNFAGHLSDLNGTPAAYPEVASLLNTVAVKGNMSQASVLYNAVEKSGILTGNPAAWFNYSYACLSGDYLKAQNIINGITPVSKDEADLKKIELIRLGLQMQVKDVKKLSEADKSVLGGIDDGHGKYALLARDLLQMSQSGHDYIFKQPLLPVIKAPQGIITRGKEYLDAYPNPTHERLTVRYSIKNIENYNMRMVNELGQEVKNIPLLYNETEFQLDISGISEGVYVIILTDGKEQHRARFVKN